MVIFELKDGTNLTACDDAPAVCSLAPMMMSHSMIANSPNMIGKTQFETVASYRGHNIPGKAHREDDE